MKYELQNPLVRENGEKVSELHFRKRVSAQVFWDCEEEQLSHHATQMKIWQTLIPFMINI